MKKNFAERFKEKYKNKFGDFSDESFLIIPSFVDVHVHLREPGFFFKETIASGSRAAAASGYGHIFSMPNLNPVPDTLENLKVQLMLIEKNACIDVRPYGAITMGEQGRELAELEEMAPFVIGFSDDGVGLNDPTLMREAMRIARRLELPIVAHCEDLTLRDGGYIHDGVYARRHGHKGISSESEWRPMQRDLALVQETGCKYHVCHISTKESVELIAEAKARGLDVSCETAPHYLLLCDEDLQEDGRFKMNPPIRGRADQEALLRGILDGTIDMIATDHAPHAAEEKAGGLRRSLMGVPGLESAFAACVTALVEPGVIPLERLAALMSVNPARRFSLPGRNGITAGAPADLTVADVTRRGVFDAQQTYTQSKRSPFDGLTLTGAVCATIVNGEIVWKEA